MATGYLINLGNSRLGSGDSGSTSSSTFTQAATLGSGTISYSYRSSRWNTSTASISGDYVLGTDGNVYFVPSGSFSGTPTSISVTSAPDVGVVMGTTGSDGSLTGTATGDYIYDTTTTTATSGTGNDTLYGGAGNDTIVANDGNDVLYGGTGNDLAYVGAGNDSLDGGSGNDTLYGGAGNDTLDGGAGNDSLYGGDGSDSMAGNLGSDTIDGGSGDDIIHGDAGATVAGNAEYLSWTNYGGWANGTELGGGFTQDTGGMSVTFSQHDDGALTKTTTNTSETIYTTSGEPFATTTSLYIEGDGGANISTSTLVFNAETGSGLTNEVENLNFRISDIDASSWHDRVTVRAYNAAGQEISVTITVAGNETVSGNTVTAGTGNGNENPWESTSSVLFTVAGPVHSITIEFDNLSTAVNRINVSDIHFTTIYDTTGSADTIYGGDGNDQIWGEDGDDRIFGGNGADTIYGGDGNDYIEYGEGADLVYGGDGNDIIDDIGNTAYTIGSTIDAGAGNDIVWGTSGADSISGGSGDDTLSGEVGADTLDGGAGHDTLYGGSEDDVLYGSTGNDLLEGDSGNDSLFGGGDDDTLRGGDGEDLLDGGLGADTLESGAGNDTILIAQGDTADAGDGDDVFTVMSYGEDPTDITINGGNTGESTGLGDTLELGKWADLSTLNATDDGTGSYSGTVMLKDGSVLTFTDIEHIICFTPGTRIVTPRGMRSIETLAVGDLVMTRDNGMQPIRWIQSRTVPAVDNFAPIRIRKGVIRGLDADLLVSPQHRMLFTGYQADLLFGDNEVLVSAKHLVDGLDVTEEPGGMVTYIHMLFDQHEIVFAEGAPSESFHPGGMGLAALSDPAREELFALFPDLRSLPESYGRTARRCLKRHEARLLTL